MSTQFCAGVVGLGLEPDARNMTIGRLRFVQLDSHEKRAYIERQLSLNFERLLESSAAKRFVPSPERGAPESWRPQHFLEFVEPTAEAEGNAQAFSLAVRSVVTLINLLSAPPTRQGLAVNPRSATVFAVWERPEGENWREVPILLERPPLMATQPPPYACCPVYVSSELVATTNSLFSALGTHFDSLRVGLRRLERVFARCTLWEDSIVDLWIALESLLGELDSNTFGAKDNYGARAARVLACEGLKIEREFVADAYRLRNSVVHGHTRDEVVSRCRFLERLFPNIPVDPGNHVAWEHIMFNTVLFLEEIVKRAYCRFLSSDGLSKGEWVKRCIESIRRECSNAAPESSLG